MRAASGSGGAKAGLRRAVIHVGMHKTGTTAIQRALSGYADDRLAMSCLAPDGHNLPLIVLFADAPQDSLLVRRQGLTSEGFSALRRQYESLLDQDLGRQGRSILWSAEMLSAPELASVMAARMIGRLRPHFDRIEVIAYIRPPGPFLAAALQERLRGGRAPEGWAQMWPAYRARLAPWEAAADTIRYRLYDPARFPGGDVVADFCRQIGIDMQGGAAAVNVSDGLWQVALHYVQRRFGQDLIGQPEHEAGLALLHRQIGRLPYKPFRIAPDALRPLLAAGAGDCAWMQARLPEFNPEQGLEPQPEIAGIAAPEDLCAIAAGIEDQVMALCPAFAADPGADPASGPEGAMRRIAGALTAIALGAGRDQSVPQARIAALWQKAGAGAQDVVLVAAALDLAFYSAQTGRAFADARAAAAHYLARGWRSGPDPAPWFSGSDYLQENPDIRAAGIAPFLHYIRHGAAERRPVRPAPAP